jgi:hypothetical protein
MKKKRASIEDFSIRIEFIFKAFFYGLIIFRCRPYYLSVAIRILKERLMNVNLRTQR